MQPIKFTVHGDPAPGGSKTVSYKVDRDGYVVTSMVNTTRHGPRPRPVSFLRDAGKNNAKWKRDVTRAAAAHMQTHFELSPFPAGMPVKLTMTFRKVRAKNHYGTGKNAETLNKHGLSLPYPTQDPDTTKLLRSTEDALKGICWYDDNQVVDQHAFKRWGTTAGVVISIEAMGTEAGLFEKEAPDA